MSPLRLALASIAVIVACALAGASAGCRRREPAPSSSAAASVDPASDSARAALVVDRPYTLRVPDAYDRARPAPLVVLLHGYGNHARGIEAYFGFR